MVEEAARSPLAAWESFYVIVGSSGAALTGLQFVVIALIAETRKQSTPQQIAAFGTPTIIHFCAVLLLSAILSAPWLSLSSVSLALGACGVAGVVYGLIVVRRARGVTEYRPVFEDWLWHTVLPLIAYTMLLIAAILLRSYPQGVLFLVGATPSSCCSSAFITPGIRLLSSRLAWKRRSQKNPKIRKKRELRNNRPRAP